MDENKHKEEPHPPEHSLLSKAYGALATVSSFSGMLVIGSTVMDHFNAVTSPVMQILGVCLVAALSIGIGINTSSGYCVTTNYNRDHFIKKGWLKQKPD
jgi:hypothetical protein